MSIKGTIKRAAYAIEGKAVLLPSRWDRALVGYTIPEGTRLAVGVYDYDEAVSCPAMILQDDVVLDKEDALLDDLRAIEAEVKPIIIHTRGIA